MIADSGNFSTISSGVSGAMAPDRGDPLSPTTTQGGTACVHTHILYILAWLLTYTHTLTDSRYAHAHTLTCYTDTSVQWNTGFTCDNTDILEPINDCTPVCGNQFTPYIHIPTLKQCGDTSLCAFIACVSTCMCMRMCGYVSSDSPGGTPGAGCRGNAASAGVAEL